MTCIFCAIIKKQETADIIDENDELLVCKDIHPKAPVHLLIIPKKHIRSIIELEDEDAALAGKIFLKTRDIAKQYNLSAYKLLVNVGRKGGQLVDHLHAHLMGGWNEE